MRAVIALLLLPLLAAFADVPDVRDLADGAAPGRGDLSAVAWLEGRWVGEGLGGATEEIYAPAYGHQMMGMFRYGDDGAPGFYEFTLFEEVGESLTFRIRHFSPDFSGWEDKGADASQDFRLVAVDGGTVYFEGATYRDNGDGTMDVAVRIDDETGSRVEGFRYRRAE